jgi:hypothetical protein
MNDTVIQVEHLSKLYHIGRAQQRHDTLRDAIANFGLWIANLARPPIRNSQSDIRNTDDPQSAIRNPRKAPFGRCEMFRLRSSVARCWVSLRHAQDRHRAQRGGQEHACFDRLNTRLKILSRITEPTEGAGGSVQVLPSWLELRTICM